MLFSSVTFLYWFLVLALGIWLVVPKRFKNFVLLVSSLIFYFFGEPSYTVLLLFSSLSDYLHSLYIEKYRGKRQSRVALISSIVINIGLLCVFKYTDFLISIINSLTGSKIPFTYISLPVGISFFTFQTMSYTIDVYRGRVKAQKNLITFAAFVSLFPQLVAGPIVRYSDIETSLENPKTDLNGIYNGVRRFTIGLSKKMLLANAFGELCSVFRASNDKSVIFYWIYAVAYTMQVYFDFSGYSDMAIGIGRMFGFSFPENFDYPYISRSITEFWRRWHMTLGGWFKDYVYIPMGGSRCGRLKLIRNIAVVWVLTGLWHGAEWNFVLWGAMYGILLIIEKLWFSAYLKKWGSIRSWIITMFFTVIGFVIFGADGGGGIVSDLSGMFGLSGLTLVNFETVYYLKSYGVLFAIGIVGCTPVLKDIAQKFEDKPVISIAEPVFIGVLLILSTAYIVDGSFNPFLYFRF